MRRKIPAHAVWLSIKKCLSHAERAPFSHTPHLNEIISAFHRIAVKIFTAWRPVNHRTPWKINTISNSPLEFHLRALSDCWLFPGPNVSATRTCILPLTVHYWVLTTAAPPLKQAGQLERGTASLALTASLSLTAESAVIVHYVKERSFCANEKRAAAEPLVPTEPQFN